MVFERLHGLETSRGPLRLLAERPGRFPEERDAVLAAGEDERALLRAKHFSGRPSAGVRPWLEAAFPRDDECLSAELVAALAALLPPGGYLMLTYGDDETERGLKRRFPPVVTPLGKALLDAGCTWFKDWYYPEGWMEGGLKLQGNKPLTDEARTEGLARLRREVEEWLARVEGEREELVARARKRARALLA